MKHRLALLVLGISAINLTADSAFALTPIHIWSKGFGNTSSDVCNGVATDPSGNVFVTGSFSGTVNLGGINLVGSGQDEIFIAKYDAAGVHQWSQKFGSSGMDYGTAVATDASGNVYVIGEFSATVNFGGGNLISAGTLDIVVAKYDANSVFQWAQRFGNASSDYVLGLAVDPSGNVIVAGYFSGTVNFGGSSLVAAGSDDIFLAKYNSAGVHQWSQRFGSTSSDLGTAVATDASGNVYLGAMFQLTVSFGGVSLVSTGDYDGAVAKYNSAGVYQWTRVLRGAARDQPASVACDASGNVLVTGIYAGTTDFGGGGLVSAGSFDGFLAKYNSAGAHQWSERFGSTNVDQGTSLRVDGNGDVVVTGSFMGAVNFGGGNLTSAGSTDIFLARYDANGVYRWAQRFGDTSGDYGSGVALDASGNVIVTGSFVGTVNFGGTNVVGAGSSDIFLAKFGPEAKEPSITSISDIGNDQGRQVKIRFERSGHDRGGAAATVASYDVFRRDDAAPALTINADHQSAQGTLRADGWTQVGSVSAYQEASYGIDVPTIGDSTLTLGQYHSVFYVRARTASTGTFYDSPPDSGYSLDNLAPGAPQNFVFTAGDLSWNESSAADFDFFTVYGSNTDAFGAATVVDYSVAAAMDVTASPYVFYYVTATDFSGNEGKPAKVNTLSGVGGTPKSYVLSVSNYPNPFNPRTTVSYTVPSRGAVTVAIYAASGALVATLLDHVDRAAGAYSMDWNGRADSGVTASSGVYFARIEHASGTRSKKMVLLK